MSDIEGKYILTKISAPGWEKKFFTVDELKNELYVHLCSYCCTGFKDEESGYEQDPVTECSSLGEMLSTGCGCEFMAEDAETGKDL